MATADQDSLIRVKQQATDWIAALNDGKHHLLLAASGSVATIKLPDIICELSRGANLSIRVILTKSAANFFTGDSPERLRLDDIRRRPNVDAIYQDEDEWHPSWNRGDDILHIQLRRWAHMLVIAPLSANTLAKISTGICDNLLTSVVRAWDVHSNYARRRLIIVAPAMNSAMWTHPITAKQIKVLEDDWGFKAVPDSTGWFKVLKPQEKLLACGDTGQGAMHDWYTIVEVIRRRLHISTLT